MSSAAAPQGQARVASAEDLAQIQRTLDCVHCGLCLEACPTYRLFGREATGPRGRIYLMRGLAEGEVVPGAEVTRDLDLCLVCRACEPACPSGVRFGEMMEFARGAWLEPARGGLAPRVKRLFLGRVLRRQGVLRLVAAVLGAYQRLGIQTLLRRYGVLRFLSPRLAARDALLPEIPRRRERKRMPRMTPARGARRGRVALLEGCVAPILLPAANRATVAVLAWQGFEVVTPRAPGCCGALAAHFGSTDAARRMALETIARFTALGPLDAVLVNSAGCGAAMKEYGRLFDGAGNEERRAAQGFSSKVKDVAEFLVVQGIRPPSGTVDVTVAYADACHLAHAQRIQDAPRRLLEAVPGVRLVPLAESERCCGAGGLYNVLEPETSRALLEVKLDLLAASGAGVLATGNPGCLLQWRSGVRARNLAVEVVHPVELLWRAGEPRAVVEEGPDAAASGGVGARRC